MGNNEREELSLFAMPWVFIRKNKKIKEKKRREGHDV